MKARRAILAAAMALAAALICVATARAGEAEVRALVDASRDKVLVITWSPLGILRIAFAGQGAMRVIGMGLHHCKGPHPGLWMVRDGNLCLRTLWSEPCFAVARKGSEFELKEWGERLVGARIAAEPLGGC
jgi:hypothetical protein